MPGGVASRARSHTAFAYCRRHRADDRMSIVILSRAHRGSTGTIVKQISDASLRNALGAIESKATEVRLRSLALPFFLSGVSALIYQVCWQRLLFVAFGVDIESITIVVST